VNKEKERRQLGFGSGASLKLETRSNIDSNLAPQNHTSLLVSRPFDDILILGGCIFNSPFGRLMPFTSIAKILSHTYHATPRGGVFTTPNTHGLGAKEPL
jgi:hypothetical protein